MASLKIINPFCFYEPEISGETESSILYGPNTENSVGWTFEELTKAFYRVKSWGAKCVSYGYIDNFVQGYASNGFTLTEEVLGIYRRGFIIVAGDDPIPIYSGVIPDDFDEKIMLECGNYFPKYFSFQSGFSVDLFDSVDLFYIISVGGFIQMFKTGIKRGDLYYPTINFDEFGGVLNPKYEKISDGRFGWNVSFENIFTYDDTKCVFEFTPLEYWPYDPGDGLGPIYDSATGAQLRAFPD